MGSIDNKILKISNDFANDDSGKPIGLNYSSIVDVRRGNFIPKSAYFSKNGIKIPSNKWKNLVESIKSGKKVKNYYKLEKTILVSTVPTNNKDMQEKLAEFINKTDTTWIQIVGE
jgi:DNA/RNA endonuclease G (NUC1)